jgi:hypothetical protein
MLQLVVKIGNTQCATLLVISYLSVAKLDDQPKRVGHFDQVRPYRRYLLKNSRVRVHASFAAVSS